MRALGFCLLAASLQAGIFFEEKPLQHPCAQAPLWERSFDVPYDCTATAEIQKLSGLSRESRGESRLWIDDVLRGPLRSEHDRGHWLDPRPLWLAKGRHQLAIECGADDFAMAGIRVYDAMPKPTPVLTATPLMLSATVAVSVRTPQPTPAAPCPELRKNISWPAHQAGKTILMSVMKVPAHTGRLTTLRRGETLTWYFKVHPRPEQGPTRNPPILFNVFKRESGNWVLELAIDDERYKEARRSRLPYAPTGYVPDRWTALRLDFCPDGILHEDLNEGELRGQLKISDMEMPLEMQSSGIEFEIKGKKP